MSTSSSPFARDYTVYLGVENLVLEYDLRNIKSPIVQQSDYSRNLGAILQNQDEVNQICLTYGFAKSSSSKQHQQQKKGSNKKGGTKKQHARTNNTSNNPTTSLYLAACDDAGTVRYMTLDNKEPSPDNSSCIKSTILHHDPHGVAVVPTCAFRPRKDVPSATKAGQGTLDLISGGTDCKIHLWDITKPK
jgi:hypothetical protein